MIGINFRKIVRLKFEKNREQNMDRGEGYTHLKIVTKWRLDIDTDE